VKTPSFTWPITDSKDIIWRHTTLVLCPKCGKSALVGYIAKEPVVYGCQRCGPPPIDDTTVKFASPIGSA
jgi:predicted RNA-binding Zn-ribbon protein involved in translation (DUF1610 family)